MTIRTSVARALLLAAVVLIAAACDPPRSEEGDQDGTRAESHELPNAVTWGCEHAIPSKVDTLDPRWRQESTVVGDFGFFGLTAGDFSGFRPHKRADIQVKLPVTIEGHSGATVWIPRRERDRVGLILSDVSRRGPGNSYRIEDGHQEVRFEPCSDKNWSAWIAGLALADRKEIVLSVNVDGAQQATHVTLGPFTLDG